MEAIQKSVSFTADGYTLAGSLHLPATTRPPVVIGCHGLLSNRGSPKQLSLARALSGRGIAYFRFDHRGCGESEGDFSRATSLEARCQDLSEAVAALERHPGLGPIVGLFGSSFGGTVVLAYGSGRHIPAIITYGAPLNSADICSLDTSEATAALAKIPSALSRSLQFDVTGILEGINNILVVHGQNDEVVPVAHGHTIYALAGEPKRLVIQEGGDHRMSALAHQQTFLSDVLAWIHSRTDSP
jgi:alpha-beta hydrolase superfamily lysophospholipase